jgi:catechol 2,3-dioxygenase-like lactoylglutathione lyase family enzyme
MSELNHVGLTVGDLDLAIAWYVEHLGLTLLAGPIHADLNTAGGDRRADVFGPRWRGMKLAHMQTGNGAGVELFEFIEPAVETPAELFAYWLVGTHHIALTVEDVGRVAGAVTAHGGKQRSAVHTLPGGCQVCYCQDPWGNIVELASRPYSAIALAGQPVDSNSLA